jgi:predicted nucleotidyltransferase component of viral defense system
MKKELYLLNRNDRKTYFEVAAYEDQKSFAVIEKDYWVVWTLERLFCIQELSSHLTFKGGTSLSKIFGVIDRFSEDIDVSIEREFLGFDEDKNPEKMSSKSKQKALLDDISKASASYIQNKLLNSLTAAIASKLKTDEEWKVAIDPDDSQTLLFHYPNISAKDAYIRPVVKIEMGARAEHWPVSEHKIQSYAKVILKDKIHEPEVTVRVLSAERTFWEKATILHQYAHLPDDKKMPIRFSRHWYDFFKLLNSPIKENALNRSELLERVANHKKVYFSSGWANYDQARIGSLKLTPLERVVDDLRRDYELMSPMFFGNIPEWDDIIKAIEIFEKEFNSAKKS